MLIMYILILLNSIKQTILMDHSIFWSWHMSRETYYYDGDRMIVVINIIKTCLPKLFTIIKHFNVPETSDEHWQIVTHRDKQKNVVLHIREGCWKHGWDVHTAPAKEVAERSPMTPRPWTLGRGTLDVK